MGAIGIVGVKHGFKIQQEMETISKRHQEGGKP